MKILAGIPQRIGFNVARELLSGGEKIDVKKPSPSKKFAAFCGLLFSGLIFVTASCDCEKLYFIVNMGLLLASGLEAFASLCVACKAYPFLKEKGFEFNPVATISQQIGIFIMLVLFFQFFSVNPFSPLFLLVDFIFRGVLRNPRLSTFYNLACAIFHDGKEQKMEPTEGKRFAVLQGTVMCFLLFTFGYFEWSVVFRLLNFVMFMASNANAFFGFCPGEHLHGVLKSKGVKIPDLGGKKE